jgi:hypothetical protein
MKYFKPVGDQPAGNYALADRWKLIMLLCSAAICIGLATSACDFHKVDASADTNSKKDGNMESTQSVTTIQYKMPPIDAAATTETETATFALG